MERRITRTLVVNDKDLECNCDKINIDNLTILNLSLLEKDLEDYDIIIYIGKRGTKILRSKFCKTGKIISDEI